MKINGEINQNIKENHFDDTFEKKNISMLQKYSTMGFLLMNGLTPMAAFAEEAATPPPSAIIDGFLSADDKPTGIIKALNGPKPNTPFVFDEFVDKVGSKAFKFANAPIPDG
jgi:hypothetical protein